MKNAETYNLIGKDYDPFGMLMVGRSFENGSGYRYGFNGKENDDEIAGNNNDLDFGERIYNSRLGKFFCVDPWSKKYASNSPFQYANNSPIWAIDFEGLGAWIATNKAIDALSIEGWQNFVKTELQRMEAEHVQMDCADTWLYLIAKYHMLNGVELTYFNAATGKIISSNDGVWGTDDPQAFENFIWGMSDAGFSTTGKYNRTAYDGFLGAYGNTTLIADAGEGGNHLIASIVPNYKHMIFGDAMSSGIHLSIPLIGTDFKPTNPADIPRDNQFLSAMGSGYYSGGGLGNSTTGGPDMEPVHFSYSYEFDDIDLRTILRPSFVNQIPRQPKTSLPEPIKSFSVTQILTSNNEPTIITK